MKKNLELTHDSVRSDMIQKDLYTSYHKSERDDNVFDEDPFCNNEDDQSILFDKDLYKSGKMDDNLILKNFIMNHDRQNYNHSTHFLNYLIFRKLTLFTTLLRHSLTNHIPPCISTNHQPPTETPEPSLFYEHYREQYFVFFSPHHVSLRINNRFQ